MISLFTSIIDLIFEIKVLDKTLTEKKNELNYVSIINLRLRT